MKSLPRYFTQKKMQPADATIKVSGKDVFKDISIVVFILVFIVIIGALGYFFISDMSSKWTELKFAYSNPGVVKNTRIRYEQKKASLDQEFLTGVSNEQKLMDEIKESIRQSKATPTPLTNNNYRY